MAQKTRAQLRTAVRYEIQEAAEDVYTDEEINHAIEDTVQQLSRLKPKYAVEDAQVDDTVSSETLTIDSDTGTLAVKPVKPKSETIQDGAGTTLVRDTDYTINYITGVVTEKDDNMDDGDYTVSYSPHPHMITVSGLADKIQVFRVEYPAGASPPQYINYSLIEDILYVHLGSNSLSAKEHLFIHNFQEYAQPTDLAAGDYPPHLDQAVVTGSVGNCLLNKARVFYLATKTALENAATALGSAGVATDVSVDSAYTVDEPTDITTDFTLDTTDLDAEMDLIDADATGTKLMQDFLDSGDDYINTVNIGNDVAAMFAQYASQESQKQIIYLNTAQKYLDIELAKVQAEVQSYQTDQAYEELKLRKDELAIMVIQAQITDAQNELNADIAGSNAYLQQAERYIAEAEMNLNLAAKMAEDGSTLVNQFINQIAGKFEHSTASGQPHHPQS